MVMKWTHTKRTGRATAPERTQRNVTDTTRLAITKAKHAMLFEHADAVGEHGRLLRLALNEAEALAWQTDYPQLVFPLLAAEKAAALVAWSERQRSMRRGAAEVSFAE